MGAGPGGCGGGEGELCRSGKGIPWEKTEKEAWRGKGFRAGKGRRPFLTASLQAFPLRTVSEQSWGQGQHGPWTLSPEGDQPGCSGGSGLRPALRLLGGHPHIHSGWTPLHTAPCPALVNASGGSGRGSDLGPCPRVSLPHHETPSPDSSSENCVTAELSTKLGVADAAPSPTSSICLERQRQLPVIPLVQGSEGASCDHLSEQSRSWGWPGRPWAGSWQVHVFGGPAALTKRQKGINQDS